MIEALRATFPAVERLVGGDFDDEFWLVNGPFSGEIEGGLGTNRLRGLFAALNVSITESDEGNVDGMTSFFRIGNISGSFGDDTFTLVAPGMLSGELRGNLGTDTLIAADVDNTFELTGPDSGTLMGITGGFFEIENLTS